MSQVGRNERLQKLIEQVRQGDREAFDQLLAEFSEEILIMVRYRMPRLLRSKLDSMDFVQSVLKSLFLDGPEQFESLRQITRYVEAMVTNKINESHRQFTRIQKYNVRRETGLYVHHGDGREEPRDLTSSSPTPLDQLQADEAWATLTEGLKENEVEVLRLRREGLTYPEIKQRLGIPDRSARRLIKRIEDRAETRL